VCFGKLGLESMDPLPQLVRVPFEVENALDSGQPDAFSGEMLNLAKALDVAGGIPPPTPRCSLRCDQTNPVVLAKGLWVHAGQLCDDRDGEDGSSIEVFNLHLWLTPFRLVP